MLSRRFAIDAGALLAEQGKAGSASFEISAATDGSQGDLH
jgi:hypothetical protein